MQVIHHKHIAILFLGATLLFPLSAAENNEGEIDMAQLEQLYQDQQQVQYKSSQYQEQQEVYETPLVEEDIRARRLREWQEQHQSTPVEMQQPNESQSTSPDPEADDLFAAAINGNTAKVGVLLAQGLDINISNNERETALLYGGGKGTLFNGNIFD